MDRTEWTPLRNQSVLTMLQAQVGSLLTLLFIPLRASTLIYLFTSQNDCKGLEARKQEPSLGDLNPITVTSQGLPQQETGVRNWNGQARQALYGTQVSQPPSSPLNACPCAPLKPVASSSLCCLLFLLSPPHFPPCTSFSATFHFPVDFYLFFPYILPISHFLFTSKGETKHSSHVLFHFYE